MYDNLYRETIVIITWALVIYALVIPIILNADDKVKHIKWSALGLKNVLKGCGKKDTESISKEVQLLYDEYVQEKPSTRKYFPNVIIWLDTIILRINTETKSVKCVSEYYETLKNVREFLNDMTPYSNCTQYQQSILKDIGDLGTNENKTIIDNILERTESEFLRLESDIRKNSRSNRLSIMIGILGIAVSFVLAIIKF